MPHKTIQTLYILVLFLKPLLSRKSNLVKHVCEVLVPWADISLRTYCPMDDFEKQMGNERRYSEAPA